MKYASYIFCLISILLSMAGCDDASPYMNDDWRLSVDARYLSIDKTEITFGADQNLSQQLHVSSVATGWKLTGTDSWVSASAMNGNSDAEVTLTATENKSGDDIRTTIMTFASTEADYVYSRPISISQSRANAYITPNQQTLIFSRDASSQAVSVDANTQWQVSSSETWVTTSIDKDAKALVVSVEENNTTTERSATLTLKGNATTTIVVKQAGSTFDNLIGSLIYGNKASHQVVSVETNGKWTASTQEEWISLSPETGNGKSDLTITVKDNPNESERSGLVSVKVGSIEKNIMISQAGTYFTVNATPTDGIPSTGGSHAVSFVSSDAWTAETRSSWVSLVPPSGQQGESVLTIKVGDNASIYERYDTTLIVIDNAYLQPYRIITRQEGRFLSVSSTDLEFYKDASSKTFTVMTDGKYEVKTDVEWLKCSAKDDVVKVEASDNTDPLPRTASVVVRLTDVPEAEQTASEKVITVMQQGEGWKLDVDKLNLSTGSDAASLSFNILCNDEWTAESSVAWASLSSTQGNGNKEITVSFSVNGQAEKRNGSITIKAAHIENPVVISIGQSGIGYYLELNKDSIITASSAFESSFAVTSNDTWTVVSSVPSWASVTPSYGVGDGSVTVSFLTNSNPEDRVGYITVTGNNSAPQIVGLRQQGVGYHLSVNQTTLTSEAVASTKSITITSNDSWTITPSVSWITVSPSAGSGDQSVKISIAESKEAETRIGQIVVAGVKSDPITIDVVQAGIGYYLEVDKTEMPMNSVASSSSFSISSNDHWSVSSSEEWATVSPSSGEGDKMISVSCSKNDTNMPRTCTLTVKGDKSQSVSIKLTQMGYNVSVDKTEITVGSSATSSSFNITSNDSWTVNSSVAWATVSPASGSGDKAITVNFSANTDPESRTGIISVLGANSPTVTIALQQAGVGYNLSVDKTSLEVSAAACTEFITITSNDSWTVSTSASWVKPSVSSGSGSKTISLEIERNTNTEGRDATVTIHGNHSGSNVVVSISQSKGGQNDITIEDFEDPIPLN